MPPHVPRSAVHDPNDPLRVYIVHVTAYLYGVIDISTAYRLPVAVEPSTECMTEIITIIQRMLDELAVEAHAIALANNGACLRILALLWREALRRGDLSPREGRASLAHVARLAPVFQTIATRYTERLSLNELADTVHLQPAYFCAFFKQAMGLSPLRYLARYRLERARELLHSTDLTLAEIATMTGYRDPFYLSRVFRCVEGIAPSEYRKTKRSAVL